MEGILEAFHILLKAIWEWCKESKDGILQGVVASVIICVLGMIWKIIKYIANKPKEISELLKINNFNDNDFCEEVVKSLGIQDTMRRNFPEYNDYLLIQYGSSVDADGKIPSDFDFIVLMLGFPKEERRYMHNKGTKGYDDVSSKENKYDVDIVFRDYLSFLYAATAGMPYENSVIINGKLIKGKKGYFQWLKNITQNHLYDRDFLVRRFEDKISTEKQEYFKCLKENEKFEHDKYYVIRAAYYYITSILQLSHIKKFDKVFFQNDVVKLSKVRVFYDDFENIDLKDLYTKLVECLKRNLPLESITIDDTNKLLNGVESMVNNYDQKNN